MFIFELTIITADQETHLDQSLLSGVVAAVFLNFHKQEFIIIMNKTKAESQRLVCRNQLAICSFQSKKSLEVLVRKIVKEVKTMKVNYIRLQRISNNVELFEDPNFSCLILIHSVKDGRFIISDDQDAHYHEFLLAAKEKIGKIYESSIIYITTWSFNV